MSTTPARSAASIANARSAANAPRRRATIVTERSSWRAALDGEGPDLCPQDGRFADETDRLTRLDLRAEEECLGAARRDRGVAHAAGGGPSAAALVGRRQGDRQAGRPGRDSRDARLERPNSRQDEPPQQGQYDDRRADRQEDRAVRLGRRWLGEPERVAVLAHRHAQRHLAAAADAVLGGLERSPDGPGSTWLGMVRIGTRAGSHRWARWCHGTANVAAPAGWQRVRQRRSAAATSASTSSLVLALRMTPSAPAARHRAASSTGACTHGDSARPAPVD